MIQRKQMVTKIQNVALKNLQHIAFALFLDNILFYFELEVKEEVKVNVNFPIIFFCFRKMR